MKNPLAMAMPQSPKVAGVLGVFYHVDEAAKAVRSLRQAGYRLGVMSPIPHHEIEQELAHGPSFVRWICFIGGATGLTAGLSLALYTALSWPLVVAGKELTSVPPYMVIGFEATILLGALFNFLGMLSLAGLPAVTWSAPYDPRFSEDRIGIWVPSRGEDATKVERLLTGSGAEEVRIES